MPVEERQRVGIDDLVRMTLIDRPSETQFCSQQRSNRDVGEVAMEHSWHAHEVAWARQAVVHGTHASLMCFNLCFRPTASRLPLEPHTGCIPRNPHTWLLQTRLDNVGWHRRVHYQAGMQSWFNPAGFAHDYAAQGNAEGADTLEIKLALQDPIWISLVQDGKLVQCKDRILRQVRDDAAVMQRPAVRQSYAVLRQARPARQIARTHCGTELRRRQTGKLMAIREGDDGGDTRLVNGDNDIAVRNKLLNLKSVHLAIPCGTLKEQQYRVRSLIDGGRDGWYGAGGDVLEMSEE